LSGGRIRWRTIQAILDAGYVDVFRHLQPDLVGSTFSARDPHVRLDYLFLPATCMTHVYSCTVVTTPPAPDASDHLPLMAQLEL
jgi:endonuclease/exonuclease/phosphatase family metal-dependent hydrolase